MAKISVHSGKSPSQSSSGTADRTVYNGILLSLPGKEYDAVFPELEFVDMNLRDVLNETAKPIEFCYFVNSGLASILTVMKSGKSVEVGLAGKEGFVGLPLVVGFSTSSTRALVQIAGTAFRLTADGLLRALRTCSQLEKSLQRYSQQFALQASQGAACNRLHEIEARLARWLLMSQDRIETDVVPLTQEFLAHMLGTRRASVTVAAGILQKAGLIKYTRGGITVIDRPKLLAAACEYYDILNRQSRAWQHQASD
jgi:CRP-like cAMP-binding protein